MAGKGKTNKGIERLTEGVFKGGQNARPSTPRPASIPAGQGGSTTGRDVKPSNQTSQGKK